MDLLTDTFRRIKYENRMVSAFWAFRRAETNINIVTQFLQVKSISKLLTLCALRLTI